MCWARCQGDDDSLDRAKVPEEDNALKCMFDEGLREQVRHRLLPLLQVIYRSHRVSCSSWIDLCIRSTSQFQPAVDT